jgi:hypothetical protein
VAAGTQAIDESAASGAQAIRDAGDDVYALLDTKTNEAVARLEETGERLAADLEARREEAEEAEARAQQAMDALACIY